MARMSERHTVGPVLGEQRGPPRFWDLEQVHEAFGAEQPMTGDAWPAAVLGHVVQAGVVLDQLIDAHAARLMWLLGPYQGRQPSMAPGTLGASSLRIPSLGRSGAAASPGTTVDDAALVKAGRHQGHGRAGDLLDLLDELDGRPGQLVEAASLQILDIQIVGKGQGDVGGAVDLGSAAQQDPVEFRHAALPATDRALL